MTSARARPTPVGLLLLMVLLAAALAYTPPARSEHGPVHAPIAGESRQGGTQAQTRQGPDLASNYLQRLYVVFLGFVGVAALFAITLGGVLYMFADSLTTTAQARRWISNGIAGIVIAGLSVLLLRTINPDLVTNFNIQALVGQSAPAPTTQQRP